jgi:hypothetical protein
MKIDGEFMQAELFLDLQQQRVIRLVQPEPDKGPGLLDNVTDLVDANVTQPLAIPVGDAVNDAGHDRSRRAVNGSAP